MSKKTRGLDEANVTNIDTQIDSQLKRYKSIKGKAPDHNHKKERIRDTIERMRDRRDRLTGNPQSHPAESVQMESVPFGHVDYIHVDDELRQKRARKRKREVGEAKDPCWDSHEMVGTKKKNGKTVPNCVPKEEVDVPEDVETLDEVLTVAGRHKRAMQMKKNKGRLKMGAHRQQMRVADKARLKQRARREARALIVQKLTRGVSKGDLSAGRKAEIERRIAKMGARLDRLSMKILPRVRKRDIEKHRK